MALISAAPPYVLASTQYGMMLVNSNDVYMGIAYMKYGECCQIETDFLLPLLQSSGLVIEVGSNMGIHTVPMALELARQGRTMMAFEPQPIIFQQLCANLALNGLMNVTAMPYACGAEAGSVSFTVPNYRAIGNFGATEMMAEDASAQGNSTVHKVACFPLDSFVPPGEVALIKIDVEGFELAVLQGALQTLERARPILYVENDRAASSKQLIQWLLDHGYRLWWHTPLLFNPGNCNGVEENLYPGVASLNMLCVPVGRECPVQGLQEILEPCVHPVLL
jgi:FkbM family methyltransferase